MHLIWHTMARNFNFQMKMPRVVSYCDGGISFHKFYGPWGLIPFSYYSSLFHRGSLLVYYREGMYYMQMSVVEICSYHFHLAAGCPRDVCMGMPFISWNSQTLISINHAQICWCTLECYVFHYTMEFPSISRTNKCATYISHMCHSNYNINLSEHRIVQNSLPYVACK